MGIYRTALLVAVSQANMDRHNHSSSQNHTYTSLTSGASSGGIGSEYYINPNYYNYTSSYKERGHKSDLYEFHGNVNVLLGGAMLIVISTIVCVICYCCHRKTKMRSSLYMQHHRWFDSDYNMEVYSVEQYYDMTTTSLHDDDTFAVRSIMSERPPSYECIMALGEALGRSQKIAPMTTTAGDIELPAKDVAVDENGNIPPPSTITHECDNIADRLNNNDDSERPTTSSAVADNENEVASDVNGNNSESECDMSRANGIVKLDMSKIMDHTGLPTYEAALTLKSSNYI